MSAYTDECHCFDEEFKLRQKQTAQEDKATPEGMAALDAALAKLAKINLAKIAMFDELVLTLTAYWVRSCLNGTASQNVDLLVSEARKLMRGELP